MRYLRTNTATRVTVGPFFDPTDGVSPEVALTVTNCKVTLVVDDGGVPTLVLDAAPTASGGDNDMVHITNDDAGFYDLELAAANVNYLGRAMLAITDATNHCPVFHEFVILPAVVYDSMVLGSDLMQVDLTQIGGSAVNTAAAQLGVNVVQISGDGTAADNLEAGYDGTGYAGGTIKQGVDVVAISGDTDAADNAELMFDGTGYAGGTAKLNVNVASQDNIDFGALQKASLNAATPASVVGAVGSVTGAVGSVTGAVGSVTAGVTLANGAHGGAAATMQLGGAGGLTSNVTGNLSGSVGSVTGAVGSVTGAVGSVTGAVGSVTGAVGSVTGSVGGNVDGSVGSVTAGVTVTTNNDKTGYALSAAGVQAIWDALISALTTVNSIGKRLVDYVDAAISGRAAAGDQMDLVNAPNATAVTAIQSGLAIEANVQTHAAAALTAYDPPTKAELDTAVSTIRGADSDTLKTLSDQLDTVTTDTNELQTDLTNGGRLDLLVDAIKAKTDNLPAAPAATGDIPTANTIADQVWDEAIAGHVGAGSTGAALNGATAPSAATIADAVWDEAAADHNAAGTMGEKANDISTPPTAGAIADAVWDETAADHDNAGSMGEALNAAGSAADPLLNTVPGSYASGTAGHALGRIGSGQITTTYPVTQSNNVTIVKGDDYSNTDGLALDWTDTTAGWPTLTDATVTLAVKHSSGTWTKAGSVVTATGDSKKVRCEPLAADTVLLPVGTWDYHVQATLTSARSVTLVKGKFIVLANIAP